MSDLNESLQTVTHNLRFEPALSLIRHRWDYVFKCDDHRGMPLVLMLPLSQLSGLNL